MIHNVLLFAINGALSQSKIYITGLFALFSTSLFAVSPTGFGALTVEAMGNSSNDIKSFTQPLIAYIKTSEYLISKGYTFNANSSVLDASQKPILNISPQNNNGKLSFKIELPPNTTIGVLDEHSEIILTPHDIAKNYIAVNSLSENIKPISDTVSSWSCEVKNIKRSGLFSSSQNADISKAIFSKAGDFWSACSVVA